MRNLQVRTLNYFMKVTGHSQIAISWPVVGSYRAFVLNTLLSKRGETGGGRIRNDTQTNSAYSVFTLIFYQLSRPEFFLLLLVLVFPVSFRRYRFHQLQPFQKVDHVRAVPLLVAIYATRPRRFCSCQFKNSLNVFSPSTVFLTCYPPDCTEPENQWFPSALENRSGSNRTFVTARGTAIQATAHCPRFSVVATWTTETVRPTQVKKVVTASLFGGDSSLQFLHISGIILHREEHHILWVRQSSEYPNK
jgi:hypothetical protein